MKYTREKFDQAVWKTVSSIKEGQVMSYGVVARVSGFPRHARMVSQAMGRSVMPLPWHRVVRSNFTLAFAEGSDMYKKQQALLKKEGVQLVNGRLLPLVSVNANDLDELLWGDE